MGPRRYFIVKSSNMANWDTARRYGAWAAQTAIEGALSAALRGGATVVLFLTVQDSGHVQGYGRMMTPPGRGPGTVPWQDVRERVANFGVAWDCVVPLPFNAVRGLTNPWAEGGPARRGGVKRGGSDALLLHRQRDGQELAPPCGEALLTAMNRSAFVEGRPAVGPLAAHGLVGPSSRGRPLQYPGSQHQAQALVSALALELRQADAGGMGAPFVGIQALHGGQQLLQQPPPPPPGGRLPARDVGADGNRGLARFVGRLEGLAPDDPAAGSGRNGARSPQRRSPLPSGGGGGGHRRGSRSRSRSPVLRNNSSHNADGDGSREEEVNPDNVTYEMYLAAYDKVQRRLRAVQTYVQPAGAQQSEPPSIGIAAPQQQQQQQRGMQPLAGGDGGSNGAAPAAGSGGVRSLMPPPPSQQQQQWPRDGGPLMPPGGALQQQQQQRMGQQPGPPTLEE